MKVSVIVASCGRPVMLEAMLDSLTRSTNWIRGMLRLEVVMVIDQDVRSLIVAGDANPLDGMVIDYSPERRGALAAWNRGLHISSGDVIVPAGDDQLFHANWLDYAIDVHQNDLNGYGVVGMNDLAYNENQVATMILFDRQYCKDHMGGVIAPPVYKYYCIDSEWNEKAKMLGRFYRDMRAKVEHIHSAHGKRPLDDLDREKMDAGWIKSDNETFEGRKSLGFPVVWEPVI